ncbi:alpha/beta fold hydrolase [Burkholderia sp. Ac-20379]|uniref:alpha/beta fold hydrolase n=1 Tax=Burkholderia sp. Ac-20379 TaxID=2703900 RepID=UPI00197D8A3E|nr:alpha/beta hydrolase [Burkholderia sp. Ac-20379]MBN3728618.1 alpha/beta hydrolase [Burkholderia sp. Ac-20379]
MFPNRTIPIPRWTAFIAAACVAAALAGACRAAGLAPPPGVAASVALPALPVADDDGPAYGPELEGFDYPYPVHRYAFASQRETMQMAYLDVKPAHPNGRTAVLLHDRNFCAATWEGSIAALTQAGYRVIAPDQIGFCKSTKPAHYQYTFQQLAHNTHALLESIGVKDAIVIGHSTGGMLAVRYALMYPKQTQRLVLLDPMGLEDGKALGVPPLTVDYWYARALKTTGESVRRYEQTAYYAGEWSPDFERWVQMQAGMVRGAGRESVAWNAALFDDISFTQPVLYEFGQLRVPTLLVIGGKDTAAIGKDAAPPDLHAKLGRYAELGKRAQAAIPGATLVEFASLGHAPQMQDPVAVHKALLAWLAAPASVPPATGSTSASTSAAAHAAQ